MIVQGGYSFENILSHGRRATGRALERIGAFLRSCMRRAVRRVKHKSSPAGKPPYAHSGIYKASILFATDAVRQKLYVGPQMLGGAKRNNAGQSIPEILEHGGYAAHGTVANWWHKRAPFMTNFSQLVRYVEGIGKGPLVWGNSVEETQVKMNRRVKRDGVEDTRGGERSAYRNYKRYSPVMKKKVYLHNIKVWTRGQATAVANTILSVYGMPSVVGKVDARPLASFVLAQASVRAEMEKIYAEEQKKYSK